MKIGIFGVAGHNRGDDAIAASLCQGLRSRLSGAKFVVPYLVHRESCDGSDVIPFALRRRSIPGILDLISRIRSADVVIVGGGSLVQDKLGGGRLAGVLGYAWMVVHLAKWLGKPVFSAPLGIDQLTTGAGVSAAREVLSKIDYLTVRDSLSADNAVGLGFERPGITPDPVFGWDTDEVFEAGRPYVVIAPAFEGRDEQAITDLHIETIELLLAHTSFNVVIVAMDDRLREDRGGIEAIYRGISKCHAARVSTIVPATAMKAAAILRNSAMVVGMRLHALILAYGHTRLFCISRTTKTDALMLNYCVDGVSVSAATSQEIFVGIQASLLGNEIYEKQKSLSKSARLNLEIYYDALFGRIEEAMARL